MESLEGAVPAVVSPAEKVSILFPVFVQPPQLDGINEFNPPLNIKPVVAPAENVSILFPVFVQPPQLDGINEFNPPLNIKPVVDIQITEVGPQPEPPTHPIPQLHAPNDTAILIGLLSPKPGKAEAAIDPQPEPPKALPAVQTDAFFSQPDAEVMDWKWS